MLLKKECKLYSGSRGCCREARTLRGSVLSAAGRNCCNYTAHRRTLCDARTHEDEMTARTSSGTSYGFGCFVEEVGELEDKNNRLESPLVS